MTSFIVNPASTSFEQIRAELKSFVDSAPDSLKWQDLFDTGAGQTIIDIVAALGAFLSYDIIVARREAYLKHAQNKSSAVGAAEFLGYSVFRGRNQILELTVTPNTTILLPKYTSVGYVKDQNLLLLEDTAFNAGVPINVKVLIGTLAEEELTITTTNPSSFRFTTTGISKDIRVFLNSVEVPTAERLIDLISEKFVVQTNSLDSVDVMYLNLDTFTTRYNIGDTLKIEWVILKTIEFTTTEVNFDYGTLTSFVVNSLYKEAEDINSIKVNAPLNNETQFIIRGRDDYMKVFKLLDTDINDTAYTDVSAAVVDLSYVHKNSCLFTNTELSDFVVQLSSFRSMGLKPPTISHPKIVFLDLQVVMQLLSSSGNPTLEAETILSGLEKVLEQSISFADVENSFESLDFVKIARINYKSTVWAADTTYRRGKHVKASPDNGKLYKMNDLVYTSGVAEPTWPSSFPLGQSVNDNRLVWCLVDKNSFCPPITPPIWTASTRYKIGDVVVPSVPIFIPNLPGPPIEAAFQVCKYINKSKADTPATFAGGNYTGAIHAQLIYGGTLFVACQAGTAGNSICLTFDGIKTVQQVVDDWNTANPVNCVVFDPPANNTLVLPAGVFCLSGGANSSLFTFAALNSGANGNDIILSFDGVSTVSQVVTAWNTPHPTNQVALTSGSGGSIVPTGTVVLTGGANVVSGQPVWPLSILPPC